MKPKKCNLRLIKYELFNITGNPFIPFFGIIFPPMILMIMTTAIMEDIPVAFRPEFNTSLFITMSLLIPMAVVLLGYSANYSQELEKEIPVRMNLFGLPEKSIMLAKIIAQMIAMTTALVIYTVFSYSVLDLETPGLVSALCFLLCLYLLGVLFFLLAHGLCNILKKFGPVYAICMIFYFGSMILCGMMGIQTDRLPKVLQHIAALLPMSYISSDFIEFWKGGSYNFGPMIQSYLFFGAVCGILLVFANYRNRRYL